MSKREQEQIERLQAWKATYKKAYAGVQEALRAFQHEHEILCDRVLDLRRQRDRALARGPRAKERRTHERRARERRKA